MTRSGRLGLAGVSLFAMLVLGQNCVNFRPSEGVSSGASAVPSNPPTPSVIQKKPIELWYWHHSYLSATNASEPAKSKALVDRAVAAGYTGLALWDSSVAFIDKPGWNRSKLVEVVNYARSKGLKVLPGTAAYGYSNDTLQNDPNLAEGQRVVGTRFQVIDSGSGSRRLQIVNSLSPVNNTSFESGKTAWFNTGDARTDVDTSTAHSGSASAIIRAGSGTNARLTQKMTANPWRLYHISFWAKTSSFSGGMDLRMLDLKTGGALARLDTPVTVDATQDWKRYDFTFNSQTSTEVYIYLGNWGGSQGTVWVDELSAEETGLINVIRRAGAPLRVYDPSTNQNFTELTDFSRVEDPVMLNTPGFYNSYHTVPTVSVPNGSSLTVGQTVAIDYYTIVPIFGWQVGACLTELGYKNLVLRNISTINEVFGADSGLFFSYDEMRHGNSCDACRKKNLSAGQLLADQVKDLHDTVFASRPNTDFYVWNDMFSPFHNAKGNYYLVEGDWAESWKGLTEDFIIMNWNLGDLKNDLKWFAGMDPRRAVKHRQIIAGYYDSGDGAASATKALNDANGIPNVLGLMYTTWGDDYEQLETFANAARLNWAKYQQSY